MPYTAHSVSSVKEAEPFSAPILRSVPMTASLSTAIFFENADMINSIISSVTAKIIRKALVTLRILSRLSGVPVT